MRCSFPAITALLYFIISNPAFCDNKDEAKRHFKVGVSLIENEDYDAAVIEFSRSVDLYPSKNGLFNLANTYKGIRRYAECLEAIERLRTHFGKELDGDMKIAVDTLETKVKELIAHLSIAVKQTGAQIAIGEKVVGTSPLEKPIILSPGVYNITVTLEGYKPTNTRVSLYSRQKETLTVSLDYLETSSATATSPNNPTQKTSTHPPEQTQVTHTKPSQEMIAISSEPPKSRRRLRPIPFTIAASITGALGLTTLILDTQTKKAGDRFDDTKQSKDLETAQNRQLAERIMFGATLAGAATTTVFFFLTDFKKERKTSKQSTVEGLAPVAFQNGAGAVLKGKF